MTKEGPIPVDQIPEVGPGPGAYILSRDGKNAHYVGRSDTDLGWRLRQSVAEGYGYRYFWFQYAPSPMQAYRLECNWYHEYGPSDNTVHPAVPPNANWRCPVSGCPWS